MSNNYFTRIGLGVSIFDFFQFVSAATGIVTAAERSTATTTTAATPATSIAYTTISSTGWPKKLHISICLMLN